MKFSRCMECGNTETNETGQRLYCTGGGEPLRKHPQIVMKPIGASEVVEIHGGDKAAAAAAFGLDESEFGSTKPEPKTTAKKTTAKKKTTARRR